MTITQLHVFVKTVELGSFTKAGEALNMTQPAVSHAISSIEAELGVALLIRDRRKGLILTEVGKRVLVHIRKILNGVEQIEQEVAAEKGFEIGTIRIGSFPIASAHFVPKILSTFQQRYPKLELLLHEGTMDEINHWLAERMIDVGIVINPDKEMDFIPLTKKRMLAVLREDHPLADRASIRIEELENEPLIICKGGYDAPIIELFQTVSAKPRIEYAIHNVSTLLNMVEEGLGVSILSELSLTNLPEHVVTRPLEPLAYREIGLSLPSVEKASLAVQLFIQIMKEKFGGEDSA